MEMAYTPIGVWTLESDPQFVRANGTPERLIHICPDRRQADALMASLKSVYQDVNLFIREM